MDYCLRKCTRVIREDPNYGEENAKPIRKTIFYEDVKSNCDWNKRNQRFRVDS